MNDNEIMFLSEFELESSNTTNNDIDINDFVALSRSLQRDDARGRTILTILYLVVLGLCFFIPIFYYFRMHCEDRRARLLHERVQGYVSEIRETQDEGAREEARAARKKYRDEKRARIKQLFEPVRMVLQSHHFHDKKKDELNEGKDEEIGLMKTGESSGMMNSISKNNKGSLVVTDDSTDSDEENKPTVPSASADNYSSWELDTETAHVEIPVQGLGSTTDMRLVADLCAICLSNYEPGEVIVWSTNSKCEHAFHEECIERWLMKQRGPPLCPCCRSEFVIDTIDEDMHQLDAEDTGSISGRDGDNNNNHQEIELSSGLNPPELLVDNLENISNRRLEERITLPGTEESQDVAI